MIRLLWIRADLATIAAVGWPFVGAAQVELQLPSPLRLVDVVRIAGERRAESKPHEHGCGPPSSAQPSCRRSSGSHGVAVA